MGSVHCIPRHVGACGESGMWPLMPSGSAVYVVSWEVTYLIRIVRLEGIESFKFKSVLYVEVPMVSRKYSTDVGTTLQFRCIMSL